MPRKSKITAVPIDMVEGLIRAQMTEDELPGEQKTYAQEMSELINEVNTEQEVIYQEEEPEGVVEL